MSTGVRHVDMTRPRRNDPCPCGSRLKFKHCRCPDYHPTARPRRTRIEELELEHPTRARAVIAWIDENPMPDRRPPKRADAIEQSVRLRRQSQPRSNKRHVGRPGRLTREERRKAHYDPESYYDPEEAARQRRRTEINRLLRKLGLEGQYDGEVAIALAGAAYFITPDIMAANDLEGDETQAALIEWLVGNWGQFIHDTANDLSAFRTWRAAPCSKL